MAAHGGAAALALAVSTLAPRPGEAALLVPLGGEALPAALAWANAEGAPLLELDTARGRVIARLADDRSAMSALAAGLLPLAARTRACQSRRTP